jgi:hypothetical protein
MDVVDKVMHTYGMMENLTPEQEQEARERLIKFLSGKTDDAHHLTVEGLKFLRGERLHRTRRVRSPV